MDKFSDSDEYSVTKRHKKRSKKFKEREDKGKKHRKNIFSLYCYLRDENKSHTYREFNVLKARVKIKTILNMEKGLQEEVQIT